MMIISLLNMWQEKLLCSSFSVWDMNLCCSSQKKKKITYFGKLCLPLGKPFSHFPWEYPSYWDMQMVIHCHTGFTLKDIKSSHTTQWVLIQFSHLPRDFLPWFRIAVQSKPLTSVSLLSSKNKKVDKDILSPN